MPIVVPKISKNLLEACFAHGQGHYPEESCGVLSGPVGQEAPVDGFTPIPNIINALHAKNPQHYPRTGRNGYVMDPLVLRQTERELAGQKRAIRIYMHSHIEVGAYFSDEDKARALWAGQPIAPGIAYLVCGIQKKGPDGAILACYHPSTQNFEVHPVSSSQ